MLKRNLLFAAIPGIALLLSLTSCSKQYYPVQENCSTTQVMTLIPNDDVSFSFNGHKILYSEVVLAKVNRKGSRFFVLVTTRRGKKYAYFADEPTTTKIYNAIRCRSALN